MSELYIFIGPPGSGKGTQAELICAKLELTHFDMGKTLRNIAAEGGELGERIRFFTDKGELVPIEVIKEVINHFFKNIHGIVVLDGFPRSLEQTFVLDEIIHTSDHLLKAVVLFDVDKALLRERIVYRRVCPETGKIFNLKFSRPEDIYMHERLCGVLVQRDDDTEAVFNHRYQVYQETTKPIIDFYRTNAEVISIDASRTVEEIQQDLETLITAQGE